MNVFPDFDGFTGSGDLKQVIGALLTIVLIVAVPTMTFSDIIYAIATSTGNYAAAGKARTCVLIVVAAAGLAGSGIAWVNWFITSGNQL